MVMVAMIFFWLLVALAVHQSVLMLLYVRLFFRRQCESVADGQLPKVAIVMSLRGADPHLAAGLKGLIRQDYPNHSVEIVVDSEQDPAAGVVRQVIEETRAANARVRFLRRRPATCSLQCASMAQLVGDLDESIEVAVHVDGDTVVPPDFLRRVVQPLAQNPKVGAAHGNRWFMPASLSWGSLVRYLWNSGAVVTAHFLKVPCGGTLAMRTSMLWQAGMVEKWETCLTSDVVLGDALDRHGYTKSFVPSLMIPNREDIPLRACMGFFARQMLWSRLYRPWWAWWGIVSHGITTTVALFGALAVLVCGWVIADPAVGCWSISGVIIYELAMLACVGLLEFSVRHAIRSRGGEPPGWLTLTGIPKLVAALPLTQSIQFLAVLRAVFLRRIAWRGVTYEIRSRTDVRMVEGQAFEQPEGSTSLM